MATETKDLRGKPLFDAVIAHLEANPEIHDQDTYGERNDGVITGCLALWTVVLVDGADALLWYDGDTDDDGVYGEDIRGVRLGADDDDDDFLFVSERAQALLQIEWSGRRLFNGDNTMNDLHRIGAEIWPTEPVTPAA